MLVACKDAFWAFGILYYPIFEDTDSMGPVQVDDADMVWATTCEANFEGTGYVLDDESIRTLAALHHLPDVPDINPAQDIRVLAPDITAAPMYPNFPTQVMEMPEAQFRYDQRVHYFSTYGIEYLFHLHGVEVHVSQGWLPSREGSQKTIRQTTLVHSKVLKLVVSKAALLQVVSQRLALATRMHPVEIRVAVQALSDLTPQSYPRVAFHENMMEMIRVAAEGSSATLENMVRGVAQHPGDVLKAICYVLESSGTGHLATRQKKAFCRALESWEPREIACNAVDVPGDARHGLDKLSLKRFAGPHLRAAAQMVESRQVKSWNSEIEHLWYCGSYELLLEKYCTRPGILLRSLTRLQKAGCPPKLLEDAVLENVSKMSLPTLVRTITIMSAIDSSYSGDDPDEMTRIREQQHSYAVLVDVLEFGLHGLLSAKETPLRGKKVFLETNGISLKGSVLMPNDTGDTGTAWPPTGFAFVIPKKGRVRFFTFWDDREKRVDVDLHFNGLDTSGFSFHVGWNGKHSDYGMVTSGDVTHSHDAVEYMDIYMLQALEDKAVTVYHDTCIYAGAESWDDIDTCFSGALLVDSIDPQADLYAPENVLFRDDMTGKGNAMRYACVDIPDHYVRILRGARYPFVHTKFTLRQYLELLFDAQDATLVPSRDEADVVLSLGHSTSKDAINLLEEGFFLRN